MSKQLDEAQKIIESGQITDDAIRIVENLMDEAPDSEEMNFAFILEGLEMAVRELESVEADELEVAGTEDQFPNTQ